MRRRLVSLPRFRHAACSVHVCRDVSVGPGMCCLSQGVGRHNAQPRQGPVEIVVAATSRPPAASISERESSLAFLKMTHYSTQPLRPHRRGRQGHPSMLPATKRWGRRLEGPLAEVARTASAFLARSAEGEAPSFGSNAAALSLYSQQRGDASSRASSSPPALLQRAAMEPARLAP